MGSNFVDPFKVNKGEYINPINLKAERAIKQVLANKPDINYTPKLAKDILEALVQEGLIKSPEKSIGEIIINKGKIPIPYELSQWGNRDEIFYKCPKCGQSLKLLANRQNYCFECGLKLDWEFTIKQVTPEIKEEYWGYESKYFKGEINYKRMKELQLGLLFKLYKQAKEERSRV